MPLWTRLANLFRGERLSREIDEELQSHLDEAIARGRNPDEARRSFGPALRTREECRDFRLFAWLDSLRADSVFAWRQIIKRKVTSAVAVLSLALAIGACTSAFRLIDAILLRPLPIANAERLYLVALEGPDESGKIVTGDGWAYPGFRLARAAAKGQAELIAVAYAQRMDLTYRSDAEMEKASVQYVSGWMFDSFGLSPAAGRLLSENDDLRPLAHPYAVISYDYWTRRFARDSGVVGRTFRMGDVLYQIVGVGPRTFTGTEPGTVVDVFLPTMMHPAAMRDDATWHRAFAVVRPGVAMEPLRAKLQATWRAFEEERAKGFKGMSREYIEKFLDLKMVLLPAAAGVSGLRDDYRMALIAMGVLVALVLLIACANVANLMTAQAALRAREMALRVSIGAGRGRLVQLMLVESAWLAMLSSAMGAWLAWWSAPFLVSRIGSVGNPVRLDLPADWRVLAFGIALAAGVTLLLGLAPALRASNVDPAGALRGGVAPHGRRRLMHGLIAAQVAFCFLVIFVAGLFATTFERLSRRPLGFSPERVLALDTVAQKALPLEYWDQAAERLRAAPGVERVSIADGAMLAGRAWNGFVSVNGGPPGPVLAYFKSVSPGWIETMKIALLDGRDFRSTDNANEALVNETFVRQFLRGMKPVGQTITKDSQAFQVVGVVRDTPYLNVRESTLPAVYVPVRASIRYGTLMVRTKIDNPVALASELRRLVPATRPELRVGNAKAQIDFVQAQTVRERLLSMLSLFFAGVALLLAAIGLYGVLDYSVLARRREIGIRMAIGAQASDIAGRVTAQMLRMVLVGAVAGLALGLASARYIGSLLYQVKPTDPAMLLIPCAVLLTTALVAALPAIVRAVRTDPILALRVD